MDSVIHCPYVRSETATTSSGATTGYLGTRVPRVPGTGTRVPEAPEGRPTCLQVLSSSRNSVSPSTNQFYVCFILSLSALEHPYR
eukprot:2470270-Rhodomonas_salina.1